MKSSPLKLVQTHLDPIKKDYLSDEMPREKLKRFGAKYLTDAELLAIILRTGTANKHVLDLSRELIAQSNGLTLLTRKNWSDLARIQGIGQVKALTLEAVFELARRSSLSEIGDRPTFDCAKSVADYFRPFTRDLSVESFFVISCDSSLKLVAYKEMTTGLKGSVIVDITASIKELILNNTNRAFILHNHPTGNRNPSEADINLTAKFSKACELVGIQLIDHVIVCGNDYISLSENGHM